MRVVDLADWKSTRYQRKLVKKALKSGRLSYGPLTRELEEKFAHAHLFPFGIFTSSGTAALKISLGALKDKYDWKDGDEVIIPSVTFVATMNAVIMNNLTPVLVDVDQNTVNMDPTKIEKAITRRTRCIIPVHLLGQRAEMFKVLQIAQKHNLRVVEDSCETMFTTTQNDWTGDIACYSSYIAHLMVTGVGGFIATGDKELATVMRSMMFHGRDEAYLNIDDNNKTGNSFNEMVKRRFHFPRFGYSDRLTEMEAALGLGDMKTYKKMIRKRQDNASFLMEWLYGLPITFPVTDIDSHAFMFFPMLVEDRDGLVDHLEARGVRTRHMMPLTTQPIVKEHIKGNLGRKYPVADYVNKHGLLIGCHQYLSTKDLQYVVDSIRSFYV